MASSSSLSTSEIGDTQMSVETKKENTQNLPDESERPSKLPKMESDYKKAELKGEGEALDANVQKRLQELLFGEDPNEQDVQRWHSQGFTLSSRVPFGLTQLYGGPCGILAPVEGFLLKELLFGDMDLKRFHGVNDPIRPTETQATTALLRALVDIIHRASTKSIVFVTRDESKKLYQKNFKDRKELETWLGSHLELLRSDIGVLLFVYSVVLSRGLQQVIEDMDYTEQGKPLVARFGHCSQEIVNLILIGQAVTNVFDGSKDMGGVLLHGIPKQSEIGYLTLLESLAYSKVGAHYKMPKNPIWVVGSQTHYTVLFALDARVGKMSSAEQKERDLRACWNELDPEEEGFIQPDKLGDLLKKIGDTRPVEEVRRLVAVEGLPVILWQYAQQHLSVKSTSPPPVTPLEDWSCSTCTFMNSGTAPKCEVCEQGVRPPPTPVKVEKKDESELKNFDLWLYNGLDGHGKCVAESTRVKVTLLGEGVHTNTGSTKRGLREVICTRWPSALVEYLGDKEPKIS